jgi:flagellin
MPQVINTNMMSLNSQRALDNSQQSMRRSVERLSSGLRINRAQDDAAGLAISERITSQIRGLSQAMRNANDGVSMLQTTEGAMQEITNSLQRMRELAVQAANGTVSQKDKGSLQEEYAALAEEIDRITTSTEFNGTQVLTGSSSVTLQVGFQNAADNLITITMADLTALTSLADDIGADAARAALAKLDADIDTITSERAKLGAVQNRLESTVRNVANVIENQSAARSRIRDADFAAETANLTRTQILQQAGTAMLAQANVIPQSVLQLLG